MKFSIDEKIFQTFSGLTIGLIVVNGMENQGNSELVMTSIREIENRVRSNFTLETLAQNPKILCWKNAYAKFGGEAKKNRSSIENLCLGTLNGRETRHINKLVDCYNLVSLTHLVPAGAEDLDKMKGSITLTFAGENELPVLLLGEKEPHPPRKGEVIYKDEIGAICRRWNWREADRTKITEETKNCILVLEGLPPTTKEEIEKATEELGKLIEKNCGGQIRTEVLDGNKMEIEI
ncbi:hypothetical protein HY988_04820 [Candidatus Micrarchaeota archaeon]|nr:hypothetical protein [Candidatus Micrarchaeota archaeon]